MPDNGYVYVLMNPTMKDLVKIGKTRRDVEERAKELSAATGIPTPFIIVYDSYFENCSEAETFIHTYLGEKGYRFAPNREFFEIPIKDAIDAVMKAKEHFSDISIEKSDQDAQTTYDPDMDNILVVEMKTKADDYYYGFGDELQDYEKALKYYLQSIKLGSIEAYQDVGNMYRFGEGVKEDKNKALEYFKIGTERGCINCFVDLAVIFEQMNHIENASKSWKKYFENIDSTSYAVAGQYIKFIALYGTKIDYIDKLIPVKDQMFDWLKTNDLVFKDAQSFKINPDFIKYVRSVLNGDIDQKDMTLER